MEKTRSIDSLLGSHFMSTSFTDKAGRHKANKKIAKFNLAWSKLNFLFLNPGGGQAPWAPMDPSIP